jgi:CreA protein
VPERGGVKGWLGVAEQVSDISLCCRQNKFAQGEDMFLKRRSLFFKRMQIVRGCDTKRNVLVYMVYSDKLIEGLPKNSTLSVPIVGRERSDSALRGFRRELGGVGQPLPTECRRPQPRRRRP